MLEMGYGLREIGDDLYETHASCYMNKSDCIFCKILAKEVPNYTVYEDEQTLAFLDIFPHVKGHAVVIPKAHRETLLELSDNELQRLWFGVKKTMERIEAVLHPDGYNAGWNQNSAAGQVVPHLHVHIMPRWKGDGGGSMHSIIKNPGEMKASEVAELFRLYYVS